jgi:hypothetical protein
MAATKKYYREDAKDAKLREAERGRVISEILGVETRNYGISTKDAKCREVEIKSCFLLRATSRPSRLRGELLWVAVAASAMRFCFKPPH